MNHNDEQVASKKLFRMNLNNEVKLPDFAVNWCRTTYYDSELNNFNTHRHSCFELHMCLEGEITIFVNDAEHKLAKGNFMLITPLENHKIIAMSDNLVRLGCGFQIMGAKKVKNALIEESHKTDIYSFSEFVMMQTEYMLKKALSDEAWRIAEIRNQLDCILADVILKMLPESVICDEEEQDNRYFNVDEIDRFINDNLYNFVSPADVAAHIGYSLRHLNRLMTEIYGYTVSQYILKLKLEKAKELLKETKISVSEISGMLGFESVNTLTNNFRRVYGNTPAKYRGEKEMS